MDPTYSTYLRLDELLSLQRPRSRGPAHDEMLFIVIHQAYELWFKELLHELDYLGVLLEGNKRPEAQFTLRRVVSIVRLLVSQMDVLETLTPRQFLGFRDALGSASGFQSVQFRELEFVLGHKRREVVEKFPEGSRGRARLEERYFGKTLWDCFLRCLAGDHAVPAKCLERDFTQPVRPSSEVQGILLETYAQKPDLAYVCELLLDLDEAVQQWRYRHVKMVERVLGAKPGTGGSTGVEYLKSTLFVRGFPDLWEIRTRFQRP